MWNCKKIKCSFRWLIVESNINLRTHSKIDSVRATSCIVILVSFAKDFSTSKVINLNFQIFKMFKINVFFVLLFTLVSSQEVFNDAFLRKHCNYFQNIKVQCDTFKWRFPSQPICARWSKVNCEGTYQSYNSICTEYDCTVNIF